MISSKSWILHTLKERRHPPKTKRFDLYRPMAPLPCSDTRLFLPHILTTSLHFESLNSTACFPTRTRPSPSSSFRLVQTIFEPNLFLYKQPDNLIPVFLMQNRGTDLPPLLQARRLHLSACQTSHNSSRRQNQSGFGTQTANQPKFIPSILSPGQPRP